MESIYKTIVLKLSGEALADGKDKTILDAKKLQAVLDAQAAGDELPVFESR